MMIALGSTLVTAHTLTARVAETPTFPTLPLQFSAVIHVTAHLIDENGQYPPRLRKLVVDYDLIAGAVRATVVTGYQAGRIYLRRYDAKKEYMIRGMGISPDCRRAYLGEPMPQPNILPEDFGFGGHETIGGGVCPGMAPAERCDAEHWVHDAVETRVHIWAVRTSADSAIPVRLRNDFIGPKGNALSLMTYEFMDLHLSPPSQESFSLPLPLSHDSCERHIGGFPYIHAFDHYLIL